MKHAKILALAGADYLGTAAADTFIIRAGDIKTVSGFDPAHDRVMFDVNHSYSDILTLEKPHDGFEFDTFSGAHLSVSAVDYNHDGIGDTAITLSGIDGSGTVILFSVDPDSLWGWNLAGG